MKEAVSPNGAVLTKTPLESVISEALKGLRYGSVEIVVHDARIVQIERKEKFRPDEAGLRLE